MAPSYPIDPARVTTVLTSCGRFDLLKETMASFLAHFEPGAIVIAEDSEQGAGGSRLRAGLPHDRDARQ